MTKLTITNSFSLDNTEDSGSTTTIFTSISKIATHSIRGNFYEQITNDNDQGIIKIMLDHKDVSDE